MRTAITLGEFLYTLNQDEDIRICLIDYMKDERIYSGWKSGFRMHEYGEWFVQDFISIDGGMEITIVELKELLD